MVVVNFTKQFRRDVELCKSRNWDMEPYKEAYAYLVADRPLPAKFRDHPLSGDWKGFREFHFAPDHLVVYRWFRPKAKKGKAPPEPELDFVRMGTHSDFLE